MTYWSQSVGYTLAFGEYKVKLLTEEHCVDYVMRTLQLTTGVHSVLTTAKYHSPHNDTRSYSAAIACLLILFIKRL